MAGSEGLVGRDPEIGALTHALERARAGTPGFWLITGEAGIGKTRLLRELAARAEATGVRILMGTATETGRNVPFLPLVAPLRRALEEPAAATGPPRRAPAARDPAASVVAGAIDGRPAPLEAGLLDTARLFEAIHDLLVGSPTLLGIDDVHWADASTIALLDYLAHRVTSARLFVVAGARDEPDLPRLPIADGRRFVPLPLARLELDEVRRLARRLAGRPVSADEVDRLHRLSAGNPFFLEQLLAGASDGARRTAGPSPIVPGSEPDVPAALHAMLRRRLVTLGTSVLPALEAMAVLGRPASSELISRVSGMPLGEVGAALRVASAAGVAVATRDGHGFRHPLYGEVIARELAGPDQKTLHARAAAALEGTGDPATIAEHWWLAGAPEAWASARAAAASARGAFAFAEVRTHLERAIASWPEDAAGLVDAQLEAAHAAWVTGDPLGALDLGGWCETRDLTG